MKDSKDKLPFPSLKENKIFASREFNQVKKNFPKLRQKNPTNQFTAIQLGNPMREDIVREYVNLFNITKTVVQYLERLLPDAKKENPKLRIRSMIPVIVVNPVLTNEDRHYILNHNLVQSCWQGGLARQII